jgi:TetR/AcrR family transcriptional regulator, transcriptional repressor for nem operon
VARRYRTISPTSTASSVPSSPTRSTLSWLTTTTPPSGIWTVFAALRTWAQRMVEQQRAQNFEGGCRLGSLAAELVESDAELQADFTAGFERWEALSRRGLLTMQQRGDLGPDADPDALAYSLLAATQGGYLLTQPHRDAYAVEAALGAAIDHIESLAIEASQRSTGYLGPVGALAVSS